MLGLLEQGLGSHQSYTSDGPERTGLYLLWVCGHKQLAQILVRYVVIPAVLIHLLLALHTQSGFQAAWWVVETCQHTTATLILAAIK